MLNIGLVLRGRETKDEEIDNKKEEEKEDEEMRMAIAKMRCGKQTGKKGTVSKTNRK